MGLTTQWYETTRCGSDKISNILLFIIIRDVTPQYGHPSQNHGHVFELQVTNLEAEYPGPQELLRNPKSKPEKRMEREINDIFEYRCNVDMKWHITHSQYLEHNSKNRGRSLMWLNN